MGILDDLLDAAEKGLEKLAPNKPEETDVRAALAQENSKWCEEQVTSLLSLAGAALPPAMHGIVKAKLMALVEQAYARGVNDAVKLAEANT